MSVAEQDWRRHVPSLATLLTLLLGLGAIEAARFGDFDLGLRFVLLAVVTDGFDGLIARRWGVTSTFGSNLDSLADLVAFGIAPGILASAVFAHAPGPFRVIMFASIALAGAWRLARFQSEAPRRDFVGLPITVGGPLFALAVAGAVPSDPLGALVWALVVSALMVSRTSYFKFNAGPLGRTAPFLAVAFVIGLAVNGGMTFLAAQAVLVAYVVVGLFWSLRPASEDAQLQPGRGRGD